MNRYLVFAFAVQSLTAPDQWFARDKAKHFFLGAFVQSATFGVAQAAGASKTVALAGASAVSLAAISAKELRDRGGRGTVSIKDGVWGLAGAVAISPVLARTK